MGKQHSDKPAIDRVVSYRRNDIPEEVIETVFNYQEAVAIAHSAGADIFVVTTTKAKESGGKTINVQRGMFGEVSSVKDLDKNEITPEARWLSTLLYRVENTDFDVIKLRSGA